MTATASTVRERPILFSGLMIRALLAGTKTQTRRVMRYQPYSNAIGWRVKGDTSSDLLCHNDYLPPSATLLEVGRGRNRYTTSLEEEGGSFAHLCPYGAPGDRLWVREAFWDHGELFGPTTDPTSRVEYRADPWSRKDNDNAGGWKPSIHMPRWASRLTLEITEVRVQRVQEISYADVLAEGIELDASTLASPEDFSTFATRWDSLNAKRGHGWDTNPWVWAITFRRIDP